MKTEYQKKSKTNYTKKRKPNSKYTTRRKKGKISKKKKKYQSKKRGGAAGFFDKNVIKEDVRQYIIEHDQNAGKVNSVLAAIKEQSFIDIVVYRGQTSDFPKPPCLGFNMFSTSKLYDIAKNQFAGDSGHVLKIFVLGVRCLDVNKYFEGIGLNEYSEEEEVIVEGGGTFIKLNKNVDIILDNNDLNTIKITCDPINKSNLISEQEYNDIIAKIKKLKAKTKGNNNECEECEEYIYIPAGMYEREFSANLREIQNKKVGPEKEMMKLFDVNRKS
jgi:hypothetical protein